MNTGRNPKTGRYLMVVDERRDWLPEWDGYPVVTAEEYINGEGFRSPGFRVINLCRHHRPMSTGYYISLLAEARGHRAMATARTLHNLGSRRIYAEELEELEELIQRSLQTLAGQTFELSVYFGQNLAERHRRLAGRLFALFPCPLFRAGFRLVQSRWELHELRPLGLSQVPEDHRERVKTAMDDFLSRRWRSPRQTDNPSLAVAILHDPEETHAPSDRKALKRFIQAGETLGMQVELIKKSDYPRLLEFDGLFIRQTTSLTNHTYRFAEKARREGMVVIDHPDSIRRCCNKVYLHELLRQHKVPVPRTEIVQQSNLAEVRKKLGFPLVLKLPDSAFSLGVFKIVDEKDWRETTRRLRKTSDLLLAQEYIPTDFDWRIGILDGQPLFACRYYMSRAHWQIYRHDGEGGCEEGNFDQVPLAEAPAEVLSIALQAANLIGRGLYGVDLKETPKGVVVIEVNDNPNIDSGIEDGELGDELYHRIMKYFRDSIGARKTGGKG